MAAVKLRGCLCVAVFARALALLPPPPPFRTGISIMDFAPMKAFGLSGDRIAAHDIGLWKLSSDASIKDEKIQLTTSNVASVGFLSMPKASSAVVWGGLTQLLLSGGAKRELGDGGDFLCTWQQPRRGTRHMVHRRSS